MLVALRHNQAKRDINDPENIVTIIRQLNGYTKSLLFDMDNGKEFTSLELKYRIHIMYGLLVKAAMWRQLYFNDFQPIHIGINRRMKRRNG